MQNFLIFIKENYSYFVYAFEFVLAIIGAVFAFVKSRRSSDLQDQYSSLKLVKSQQDKRLSYLGLLPTMVRSANILYPIHGDGQKRFEYVYEQVLRILGCEDNAYLRLDVWAAVQAILNADKLEKISRDTLDQEPKKEFSYEKKEDDTIEGSEDLRQDGEENESAECSARYVSRRD